MSFFFELPRYVFARLVLSSVKFYFAENYGQILINGFSVSKPFQSLLLSIIKIHNKF